MIRTAGRLCAGAAMGIVMASAASAEVKIRLEPFITGVNQPLAMVQEPGGEGRFFIVEQWGRVLVADKDGTLGGAPFLDIRNLIVDRYPDFDERGMLGIALHPDFAANGKFYVSYSGERNWQGDLAQLFWYDHSNNIAEYRVSTEDPDLADLRTGRIVSTIPWPQFNHNGHWLGFGPDGMLYFSTGDGGYANDWGIGHNVTDGNGQDLTSLHGKILRVDVNVEVGYGIPADNPFAGDPNAAPEIWAYGLRNPWRCGFDMGGTNQLICGDVQQNSFEEIDIIERGANYGWRRMEADRCFNYVQPDEHPETCDTAGLTMPILTYNSCTAQPDGCKGISVTGGYIYRGSHAAWDGMYIFGDWSKQFGTMDGQIFFGVPGADGKWTMEVATIEGWEGNVPYILAFAQDQNGEIYALTSVTTGPVGSGDTIYRIVPAE